MDVDRALREDHAAAVALLARHPRGQGAELGGVCAAAARAAKVLPHEQEEAPQVGRDEELRVRVVDDLSRLDRLPRVDGHVERGTGRQLIVLVITQCNRGNKPITSGVQTAEFKLNLWRGRLLTPGQVWCS